MANIHPYPEYSLCPVFLSVSPVLDFCAVMNFLKNMMPDMGATGDMMKMMPMLAKAKKAMDNAKGAGEARGTFLSPPFFVSFLSFLTTASI
jgi:hypothetical protein